MKIAIGVVTMVVMWFVARRKGFNPWLWIIAAGIPGLVVLFCLPSAGATDLAEPLRHQRRARGNLVGLILSCISVALLIGLVALIQSPSAKPVDALLGHMGFAYTLLMLISIFMLFPGERSGWKTVLRWAWSVSFAVNFTLLVLRLSQPAWYGDLLVLHNQAMSYGIQTFNVVTSLVGAIALLVLASNTATREAVSRPAVGARGPS